MSSNPHEIWKRLTPSIQQDCLTELTLICKEVLNGIRTDNDTASCQQSHHLC